MTMLQTNPAFHVFVPERDDHMLVMFVTDPHIEEHVYFGGFMEKTGEYWTLDSTRVRGCRNPTIGRTLTTQVNPNER